MQQFAIQRMLELTAGAGARSDLELLEQIISSKSESAFAQLMQRHGAMVLGVCRRILRHTQDAEDACQATFLVLAQRAAAIEKRASLSSWLYGVAARISLRLKKMRVANPTGGHGEPWPSSTSNKNSALADTLQVLDQEMARLPEQYRAPLVLCYLQGRTQDEAAKQLGWPLTTLRGRLDRGRQALRKRLQQRGFDLSVLLLGIGVTSSVSALSRTLIHTTTIAMQAGSVREAARQGLLAATVSLSAEQVMKSMAMYQWSKGAFALLAMLSLVGVGTWAMATSTPAPSLVFDDKPAIVQPATKEGRVEGRVLDEEGKPVAGATVQAGLFGLPNHLALMNAVSGADGRYVIEVPFGHGMLWGIYPPAGYYTKHTESHRTFVTSKEEPVTEQNCKLIKGMPWRILVEEFILNDGETLYFSGQDDPDNRSVRMGGNSLQVQGNAENIGTLSIPRAGGEYRFYAMPNKSWGRWDLPKIDLTIDANFQPTKVAQVKDDEPGIKLLIDEAGKTAKVRHAEVDLNNGTVTLRIKAKKVTHDKLLTMQGRILNEENKPIAGANATVIFTSKQGGASSPFYSMTDDDGNFAIKDIYRDANTIEDDSEISVSIVAPKYCVTQSKKLSLREVHTKGSGDVGTITLEKGKTLRGKVVDENGKPLHGATITDQTNYLLYQSQCRSDVNGEFVIEGIRSGKFSIGIQYGERSHYEKITVDKKNNTFTFVPRLRPKQGYREPSEAKQPTTSAPRGDSWVIQPPVKEPTYQHTPLYALVVFGVNKEHAMWMVLDGRTMYIDRNGNGDLTDPEDKLVMLPPDNETHKVGNPGYHTHFDVCRSSLLLKGHEKETIELFQWMRDEKYVPKSDAERQQKVEQQKHGHERFMFYRKKNGISAPFSLTMVRDKLDVHVLHLDGPLTFELKMGGQTLLQRGPGGCDLAFHIGTPGRPLSRWNRGTFCQLILEEVPAPVHLLVEIEFPGKTAMAEPIVKQFALKERCCGDTFHGTVVVPAEAGSGSAKVTVRAEGWGDTFVQPKTFLVPLE